MGMPKAMLRVGYQPILEYLLDQFAWPGPTMLVTAPGRQHPPGSSRFDREVSDPVAGQGPLRGVLTALENATTEWVAVATVDMPGIESEQFQRLLETMTPDNLGVAYQRRTGDQGPNIEPFPLLVRSAALPMIQRRVDAGLLLVARMLHEPQFARSQAPAAWGERVWTNLNHPADLDRFGTP